MKRRKWVPTTDLGWEILRYLKFCKALIIIFVGAFVGWAIAGRFGPDFLMSAFEAVWWACAVMSGVLAVFIWSWNRRFRAQDPKDRRL